MRKVHDGTPEDNLETAGNAVRDDVPTLDALARKGARHMLMTAMEEEVNSTSTRTPTRATRTAVVRSSATAMRGPAR